MKALKALITRFIIWRAKREADLMARAASEHLEAFTQYSQARRIAEARIAELKGAAHG